MSTTKTYPTLSIEAIAFQVSSGRPYEGHIQGCSEDIIIKITEDKYKRDGILSSLRISYDTRLTLLKPVYYPFYTPQELEHQITKANTAKDTRWVEMVQQINGGVGLSAGVIESALGSSKYIVGMHPKYGLMLWTRRGNMYKDLATLEKIKTYRVSVSTKGTQKILKGIGLASFIFGFGFDIYSSLEEEQSWGKTGTNTFFSVLGTFGSKLKLGYWGLIISGIYYILDLSGAFEVSTTGNISDIKNDKIPEYKGSDNYSIKQDNVRNAQLEQTKLKQEIQYKEPPQTIIKQQPK